MRFTSQTPMCAVCDLNLKGLVVELKIQKVGHFERAHLF